MVSGDRILNRIHTLVLGFVIEGRTFRVDVNEFNVSQFAVLSMLDHLFQQDVRSTSASVYKHSHAWKKKQKTNYTWRWWINLLCPDKHISWHNQHYVCRLISPRVPEVGRLPLHYGKNYIINIHISLNLGRTKIENDKFVIPMQQNLGISHFCRQLGCLHAPCHMLSHVLLKMLVFPH